MDNAKDMRHKIHIGIDLGTTNTVMATCKMPRHNIMRPTICSINQYIMENQIGMEKSLPSVLFFGANGKVKVGGSRATKSRTARIGASSTTRRSTWGARSYMPTSTHRSSR